MEKECIKCNTPTEESFRANTWTGFCHTSSDTYLCKKCRQKATKITEHGVFLLIDKGLVYHNAMGYGGFERVSSKRQLDNIFNKDYNEVLSFVTGQ